ncbi:leucine-rich repeat-containing protein 34 isoform X1 [Pituophis catenifer annectens]|uniref:leucine-rich repeat-containing protein 34 isoform X1 n=1 Tax=Pituophis catenifer annectens TaxID=94852 RepID=UPI003996305B
MLACMSLDQQYSETCREVKQPVNPFIKRILQEVKLHDEALAKRITVKIAGNNRLIPVQKVTDSDFQILASVFMNNVFLTGLDLRYNLLTDAGAAHIAAFIQDNRTLLYLNLMFNDIGTLGAEFIAKAMHRNETLCYLRMTGNKIENKGGMYFAAMIQVNNTIQKLDFGDCDLGTQSMIALATVLNHNESIKALNLNRPILYSEEEETTIHIASMLRVNCTLVELHLCKHGMKNFGIERLCDALYDNSTLRYLDLSWLAVTYNNISGPGLVAFSEAMKINPVLSYIYIWGNKFDEDACVAFAELLESGRLKPTGTDVEPYKVDGRVYLAELSHGLKRHYYWTPSYGDPDNEVENASLAINPVSEHL